MKLSQLERANEWEVSKWLEENIVELTPYQKQKLSDHEVLRFSPFYFYKRSEQRKVSILWRFSIILYPIYIIAILLFNPIKWILTGKWGYSQKFFDNFHAKWNRKMGFNNY